MHDTLQASTFTLHLLLSFVLGVGLQGQRAEPRGQGEDWDQDEECEIHKESIRSFKKKNQL